MRLRRAFCNKGRSDLARPVLLVRSEAAAETQSDSRSSGGVDRRRDREDAAGAGAVLRGACVQRRRRCRSGAGSVPVLKVRCGARSNWRRG